MKCFRFLMMAATVYAGCSPEQADSRKADKAQDGRIADINTENEGLRAEVAQLQDLVEKLNSRLAELESNTNESVNGLDGRVSTAENATGWLDVSVANLSQRSTVLESKIALQAATNATTSARLTALESTAATQQLDLGTLQTNTNQLANALSALASTIATNSIDISVLQALAAESNLWLYDANGVKKFPATGSFLPLSTGEVTAWVRVDTLPTPIFTTYRIAKTGAISPGPSDYYEDGSYQTYYPTNDCTGQAYVRANFTAEGGNKFYKPGLLALHGGGYGLWTTATTQAVYVDTYSRWTGSSCVVATAGYTAFPVYNYNSGLTFQGPLHVAP